MISKYNGKLKSDYSNKHGYWFTIVFPKYPYHFEHFQIENKIVEGEIIHYPFWDRLNNPSYYVRKKI